jgi:hypothetical protein
MFPGQTEETPLQSRVVALALTSTFIWLRTSLHGDELRGGKTHAGNGRALSILTGTAGGLSMI